MKDLGVRQSMGLLHSWGGLIAGWLGFAIFLTGTLAVFDDELTRWASPELNVSAPASRTDAIAVMRDLDRRSADYWFASVPSRRTPAMRIMWNDPRGKLRRDQIDPVSRRVIAARETGGGGFFTKFHYTLHAGTIGTWIVAAASVGMLVAMTSGIIVHRRFFADFFTFRPRAAPQRRWLDLHNLLAVLALPFLIVIVYTGLSIKTRTYLPIPSGPRPIARAKPLAEPPPIKSAAVPDIAVLFGRAERVLGDRRIAFVTVREDDGTRLFVASRTVDDRLNLSTDTATFDRASGALLGTTRVEKTAYLTQRVFAGLHFGQFAGLLSRWLYFLLGLTGSLMIASGLILFSIKRANRALASLTVATVGGLSAACLGHLAATRWLPFDMAFREKREVAVFLAVWAASLVHAATLPWVVALRHQLGICTALAAAMIASDAVALTSADAARWTVDAGLLAAAIATGWAASALPGWVLERHAAGR